MQVELESRLPPDEFRSRVLLQIREQVREEGIGVLLNEDGREEDTPEGVYELAFHVNDEKRLREVIAEVIDAANEPERS